MLMKARCRCWGAASARTARALTLHSMLQARIDRLVGTRRASHPPRFRAFIQGASRVRLLGRPVDRSLGNFASGRLSSTRKHDAHIRISVRSRRKPAVADRDLGRLNWAESEPIGVASGRTGVRAKAGIPLRACYAIPYDVSGQNLFAAKARKSGGSRTCRLSNYQSCHRSR
jgi:hypothetical protein